MHHHSFNPLSKSEKLPLPLWLMHPPSSDLIINTQRYQYHSFNMALVAHHRNLIHNHHSGAHWRWWFSSQKLINSLVFWTLTCLQCPLPCHHYRGQKAPWLSTINFGTIKEVKKPTTKHPVIIDSLFETKKEVKK